MKIVQAVKVDSLGRVVIPKILRDMLGVKPGRTVLVTTDDNNNITIILNEENKGE